MSVKPKSIYVTVADKREKRSKTMTVYGQSLEEVLGRIQAAFEEAKD